MHANFDHRRDRIAIVVFDLSATGVVRNAIAIANHLAARGHVVDLVTCLARGVLAASVSDAVGIVELCKRTGDLPDRRGLLRRNLPALAGYLRRTRPRALLSAGNHMHLACWAASLGLTGIARIYRISNDLTHGDAGNPFRRAIRRVQLALIGGSAARIVFVSERLREHWLPAAFVRRGVVIENGVDVPAIWNQAEQPIDTRITRRTPDEAIAIAIGRLHPQKNYPALIDALAIANARRPVRLVVLGDGGEADRAALRERARERGIEGQLDLVGVVSNPFPMLARADVFVTASQWEGAPNVLLEALACGTPVVAAATAGNARSILDEGRCGVLVDPPSPPALADAILRQLGDDRVTPGDRALHYDARTTLTRYATLIEDVLADA